MNEEKILQLIHEENPPNPLAYVKELVKPMMRNKIEQYITECEYCPNRFTGFKSIPFGNNDASIMIIGEQVLQSQLQLNKDIVYPFEGTQEMEIFNTLFEEYHINTNQIFWVNAVNCLTQIELKGEKIFRPFNISERNGCKLFLDNLIETINPNLIICLGASVYNLFKDEPFNKNKNQIFKINTIDAIALQSPTFLLQQREIKDEELCDEDELDFCNGLKKAFKYCQEIYGGNIILDK